MLYLFVFLYISDPYVNLNFSISNGIRPYVEITSWDRTPVWDREKIYKDNKFR